MSEDKIKLWAEMDAAVSRGIIQASDIDYQDICSRIKLAAHEKSIQPDILYDLTGLWIDSYQLMIPQSNQILDFSDGHFRPLSKPRLKISFEGIFYTWKNLIIKIQLLI
ncbi:MAG: hypothetical protein GY802_21010 [Gammaproteobacteria bacterium]|nr:hypothetical protein [Gammaproteobacteria bacterium]